MTLIWATRGKSWGFRFLRTGGLADPLSRYEAVFGALSGEREGVTRRGDDVGLRLVDPEGRTDRSGRPIPHDFVVSGEFAARIHSVTDGLTRVWPLVAAEYEQCWDLPEPPDAG